MKIAIVRRNGLGDLLTAVPLVALCKERYPGCHVTLFVDVRNAPLLPYLEGFDEAVVIEHSKNKYISLLKTVWKSRHRRFDLAVSARPTPTRWLTIFLAGLRAHERLAASIGVKSHQMVRCLKILDASIEEVPEKFLPKLRVNPSHRFEGKSILVSVTNQRIGSQLDADKIARHLNRAFEQTPFQVILNCEPQDAARAQAVARELRMPYQIILTAKFDDFMALLASVDAAWTGDGGVMHLMAALDKPQLVLFGKTALWEWAPLSKKAVCVWHPENVNLIPEHEIEQGLARLINELR